MTDMSGGLTRVIEKELPTETGQRVSVSDSPLAYPGQRQRLAVIPAEVLRGRPGNLRKAPFKEALLRSVEFLALLEGSNAKKFRDPQSVIMLSAA